jgi:uncharacterized protein
MSKEHLEPDLMHYDALAQEALRGVVKAALKQAASPEGIPGGHHFYITFRTRAPGVSIPPELQERYPEEMTIVLQHQFWDLGPGETFFTVTLKFGGQPKRLSVPYAAISRFYDPHVQFLLPFEATEAPPAELETLPVKPRRAPPTEAKEPTANTQLPAEADDDKLVVTSDEPKIVSLDQFRKK